MKRFLVLSLVLVLGSPRVLSAAEKPVAGDVHGKEASPPTQGVTAAGSADTLVDEALQYAGIQGQIEDLPPQITALAGDWKTKLNAGSYAAVNRALSSAFSAKSLLDQIKTSMLRSLDAKRLQAVVAWLRSPLSERMARLEFDSENPEAAQKVKAFAEAMEKNPPSQARLDLVKRLDAATKSRESSTELLMTMMRSVRKVVDPALPAEERLRPGDLEAMTKRARSQVGEMVGSTTTVQLLFDYRAASDADLAAYVAFYESGNGRWFSEIVSRGFVDAVESLAERAAADVAKAVQQTAPQEGPAPDRH